MADKGILEFVQSSKNIIVADPDDEINYAASALTSIRIEEQGMVFNPIEGMDVYKCIVPFGMRVIQIRVDTSPLVRLVRKMSGRPLTTTRVFFLKKWDGAKLKHAVTCKVFKATDNDSDEAHFWLNGYVNKQSCPIWSEANPQVYVETPLHSEKLTVWGALWAGGILLQKR
ncbi:hypothetical protein TNCV_240171 [Trichonephila clavipes]|nr:hypothetical protein TNCV_240171 [Trichonephila clavipes]